MKQKHEEIVANRLFYAFIDFGDSMSQNPTTYIIPSALVARVSLKPAGTSSPGPADAVGRALN